MGQRQLLLKLDHLLENFSLKFSDASLSRPLAPPLNWATVPHVYVAVLELEGQLNFDTEINGIGALDKEGRRTT